MPAEDFVTKLNEQIAHEYAAHQQYVACAVFYDAETFPQLARFFYQQALEERDHAMMMVQYLVDADAEVTIPGVAAPQTGFSDIVAPVALALEQERRVTQQINGLAATARAAGDYTSEQFMQWFIKEQVEEVATMSDLLRVVERSKDDPMEVENFMAREHPAPDGETRRRRTPPARELLRRAARGRRPAWTAQLDAPVRARNRRRHTARGALPLLRPPGLPVPDRLRAPARAGGGASAAAGVDAPLRRAVEVGPGDRDGPAPGVRGALGHRAGGAGVRAHGTRHRRVLRLPAAHGRAGRLRRAGGGGPAVHVELPGDRPAPRGRSARGTRATGTGSRCTPRPSSQSWPEWCRETTDEVAEGTAGPGRGRCTRPSGPRASCELGFWDSAWRS